MRMQHGSGRDVSIALLYQANALHSHLKQALAELGASVVYDSPAATFDRGALDRSGASVVVINLDPEVEEEFAQLDDLLADDALRVIFNDGEVSSRLEGWDQARWARHLAAKILGVDDTNPPRPKGSQAIPVKVKNHAPDYPSAPMAGLSFELEGEALHRALSADTGESISLTRAALVTKDEPIAVQVVDPYAKGGDASAVSRDDRPTVELPRVRIEDALRLAEQRDQRARGELDAADVPASQRPTVQLRHADVDAALAARQQEPDFGDGVSLAPLDDEAPAAAIAPDDLASQFAAFDAGTPLAADAAPSDDGLSLLDDDDAPTTPAAASKTGATAAVTAVGDELSLDSDLEGFSFDEDDGLSLAHDDTQAAPAPRAAGTGDLDEAADDLDAALRDFGFMDDNATVGSLAAADEADESITIGDDDFGSALGALNLEPFDENDQPSTSQRDAAPPPSLDDMLMQMRASPIDDAAAGPAKAPPALPRAADKPTVQQPAVTPSAAKPATPAKPAVSARDDAAAKPTRSVDDFNLGHLSLAPIDDGEPEAPTSGRASFGAPAAPATPEPPRAAAPKPVAPPPADDDFGGLTLEAMDFDFDIDAEAAAPAPAAKPAAGAPPKAATPAAPAAKPAPAPAARAAPPPLPADDTFELEAFDFSLDEDATPAPVRREAPAASDADAESDLMAELAAMTANASGDVAPAEGPVRHVWVLGASIGGPEAVREFLGAIPADAPVLFLLAQHMGADFLDLMIQQLARATPLKVRTVVSGDRAQHGEVIVVPLAERLLVDRSGTVKITGHDTMTSYSPSIDQVMRDVAERFGADAGAIIFSGMAHDAIDGAQALHARGGTIWVQDPATCVISSMVDGARDAGVVSLVGSPAELARQFMLRLFKAGG